jgi:hypothetical protein
MITKKLSLWLSLATGVILLIAMIGFAIRPEARGFGGMFTAWLIFTPIILLALPLLVPRFNVAYEGAKLSVTTSILQIVFFLSCLAFAGAIFFSKNIILNLVFLGVMLLSLLAVAIKSSAAQWRDSRRDAVKMIIVTALAFLVILWLPISVWVNPGWGTLLIYTPYALLSLVPFVLIIANTTRSRAKVLPTSVFFVELVFLILWASLAFWYVNGDDTDASMGSIISKVFGGIWGRDFLMQLSPIALKLSAFLALASLPLVIFYKQGKSKIWFVVLPIVLSGVGLLGCGWSLVVDDINSHKQAEMVKSADNLVERTILSSTTGSRLLEHRITGDGLLAQLSCKHDAVPCASSESAWAVPMQGRSWDFVWGLIQKSGYVNPDPIFPCWSNDCSEWGIKTGSEIRIVVKQIDSKDIPKADVGTKTWRRVEIHISPYDSPVNRSNGEIYDTSEYPSAQ